MSTNDESKLDKAIRGIGLILGEVKTPEHRGPTMNFYQAKGGQLQFSVAPPKYRPTERSRPEDSGIAWASKMGAVFIEAAPPIPNSDPPRLDWANSKMVFAMSDKDIGEILWGFSVKSPEIRLIHAPDEKQRENCKTFRLKREKDYNGSPQWSISLTEKKNGKETRVSLFIKGPDVMRLKTLLEGALPYIMGAHKT